MSDGLRPCRPAISAYKGHIGLHKCPFAVAGGGSVEGKEALLRSVAGQAVAHSLLQICGGIVVPLHDVVDKPLPQLAFCLRIILHAGDRCQQIRWGVWSKFPCVQVQGPIFAVEQMEVLVKLCHAYRVNTGRISQDGLPVGAPLPLPHMGLIGDPLLFVLDGQRIDRQGVRKVLA